MNYQKLKSELAEDPQSRGYARMSDAGAAADLNAARIDVLAQVSSAEVLAWTAQSDRFRRLEAAAATDSPIASVVKAAQTMLSRDETQLDLSRPDHSALIASLVQAGVITNNERDEINAMATRKTSRAQQLGLGHVRAGYVERARS